MSAIWMLKVLHEMCKFRSTEGQASLSNSEMKRWFEKGSIQINGEKVTADEKMDFPIFSFVLHPKGHNRITLL